MHDFFRPLLSTEKKESPIYVHERDDETTKNADVPGDDFRRRRVRFPRQPRMHREKYCLPEAAIYRNIKTPGAPMLSQSMRVALEADSDQERQLSDEAAPFIQIPSNPDDEAPKDSGNLVYLIILLHGVGSLMPWNMFITIAPDYYTNYKMKTFDENGTAHATVYSANFLNYLAIASQIPNLLLNFINIFVTVKGDLTKRISLSLLIVGAMIVFTMSFVYVDTWQWMGTFFAITLLSIVLLNGANGIYQNSIFGLASDFPFKFTNAVIIGNNLCGTFVTVVNIITAFVSKNTANAAFAYFGISLITLGICFSSFFLLKRQPFYQYYSKRAMLARESEGTESKPGLTARDYLDAFKQGWPQMVNVYLVFFVSLSIFPGIMVDVRDELVGQKYAFVLPERYFVPITCFLLFNVFAFIGSMLAGRYQYNVGCSLPKHVVVHIHGRDHEHIQRILKRVGYDVCAEVQLKEIQREAA
ncbi:nucleoside transporter [Teladorsagia circumcincta]|uniref:Nucleoside transporter n=1 Tax=Teladorsagia circumcincta TaxID=45464 RepID=A0A2G9V3J4_TELCI|nr:nucleoside transporter [Teladorsagia circumcincta]